MRQAEFNFDRRPTGRPGRPWVIQRPTPTGAEFIAEYWTLDEPSATHHVGWTRDQSQMRRFIDQAAAEDFAGRHQIGPCYPTQL